MEETEPEHDEIQRLLFDLDCVRGTNYSLPRLSSLCSHTSALDDEQRASTYLLYLLGCTLFVDKTQDRVSSAYLPLVMDLQRVGRFS